jgi:hypothetical protein
MGAQEILLILKIEHPGNLTGDVERLFVVDQVPIDVGRRALKLAAESSCLLQGVWLLFSMEFHKAALHDLPEGVAELGAQIGIPRRCRHRNPLDSIASENSAPGSSEKGSSTICVEADLVRVWKRDSILPGRGKGTDREIIPSTVPCEAVIAPSPTMMHEAPEIFRLRISSDEPDRTQIGETAPGHGEF